MDFKEFNEIKEDDNFKQIAEFDDSFNLFDAIGMNNLEIKHSNFLAWLMRPNEKHGWGCEFIKKFIESISEIKSSLEYDEIEVYREYKHIDILIEGKNFVVVIENKINANQHGEQLHTYAEFIEKEYSDKERIYLYLKPHDDESEREFEDINVKYHYVSYKQIKEILKELSEDYLNENDKKEIGTVVKHYIRLIEKEEKMSDKETAKKCREFYKKHKDFVDTLIKSLTARGFLSDLIKDTIDENSNFKLCKLSGERYIPFLYSDQDEKNNSYFFQCDIDIYKNSPKISFRYVNSKEDKEVCHDICELFKPNKPNKNWIAISSIRDNQLKNIVNDFDKNEIINPENNLKTQIENILREIEDKKEEIIKIMQN